MKRIRKTWFLWGLIRTVGIWAEVLALEHCQRLTWSVYTHEHTHTGPHTVILVLLVVKLSTVVSVSNFVKYTVFRTQDTTILTEKIGTGNLGAGRGMQ